MPRLLHILFLLTLAVLSLSAQGSGVPTVSYPDHSLWPESPRTASFQKTIIPQAGVLTGLGRNEDFVDFAYDSSGRLYQDSSRGISDIFYDNDGNRTQTITENGTIYDFYDGAGNHLRTEYSENGKPTVVREYTGAGHIITDSAVTRTPCPGGYFSGRGGYPLYYLTDWQGNNIATLNCLGATVSFHRYYPYGEPWREPTREEFLFSGNERVRYSDINDYDFHARRYNAAIPRFDKQDRLNEKYPWLSPYAYCAGNPVMNTDHYGDSVAVLIEPGGAYGFGHMAILIQNDSDKWELYSKNGKDAAHNIGSYESGNKNTSEGFIQSNSYATVEDFLLSSDNKISNEPKGTDKYKYKYTAAYIIPATKNEDKSASKAVSDQLKKEHSTKESNCAHAVLHGLKKIDKIKGNSTIKKYLKPIPYNINAWYWRPNNIFEEIKKTGVGEYKPSQNEP